MAEESDQKADTGSVVWADVEYASALKQLQSLQEQIDNLRSTIPSMVEAFTPPPTSNVSTTQMYMEFAKASMSAVQDLRSLRSSWQDPKTQKALEHARVSLEKNEDLDWEFVSSSRWHNTETIESIEKEHNKSDDQTRNQ